MQSNNPVLKRASFDTTQAVGERMTINGTVGKTALLLVLAVITGGWTWHRFATAFVAAMQHVDFAPGATEAMVRAQAASEAMGTISVFLWGGLIVGFILAMVSVFKPRWSGITAPVYALAEGFALGGLSAFMNLRFPGIVLQAVMLTFGVMAVMLVAYRAGWIRVTDKFRTCVMAGTGAIALLYLVDIGLRAFTSVDIPFIHESGALGIGFSLLVIGLAAMNLALDFDIIDQGVAQGAPKYMEWYGAFALMVTLVWLYMEILRLLSKLRR
ncbi:MAG TPA: Bax inhibitor-1/YccA family protein [Oleiagrimonas sp.]|nr:Bax inhibitor-1/YccA family protein [Oleiagrimonas sp.]